jgi:hypothetical protein
VISDRAETAMMAIPTVAATQAMKAL